MGNETSFLSNIIGYVVPVGSHNDPLGKEGFSKLLSGAYKHGTEKYPDPTKLFFELEKTGASFEISTGRESTYISLSVPRENVKEAKKLLDEIIEHVLTTEEAFQKIKTRAISNIEEINSDDRFRAASEFNSLVLKERKQEGTEESIESVTLQDLSSAQEEYRSKAYNFSLAGADDYKFDSSYEPGTGIIEQYDLSDGENIKLLDRDIEQKVLYFGYPTQGIRQIDRQVMGVASSIMTSGLSGLVFEVIRAQHSAAYYAYYSHMMLSNKGGAFMSAGISEGNVVKVLKLMKEIFERVASGDFEENRLDVAKEYFLGRLDRTYDSIESLTSMQLSSLLNGLPVYSYEETVDKIRIITKDDIIKYYQQFVVDSSPYLVINGTLKPQIRSKVEKEFSKYV